MLTLFANLSKMILCVLLAILLWCSTKSQIVIPVCFLGNGNPYINGSIPSVHGDEIIRIGITPYEIGRTFIRGSEFEQIWMNNVTFHVSNFTFVHDDFLLSIMGEDFVPRPYQPVASLGLGSGSLMIRRFESASMVKQDLENAIVVLNSSLDWFNSSCVADSLLNIPIISSFSRIDSLHISIGIGSEITPLVFMVTTNRFLLTVPDSLFSSITSIIRRFASTFSNSADSVLFTFCDELSSQLPEIFLIFSSGMVRLAPADYTRNIGNRTCELLIGSRDDVHVINPFLLTDINLRFTHSDLWLCDAEYHAL